MTNPDNLTDNSTSADNASGPDGTRPEGPTARTEVAFLDNQEQEFRHIHQRLNRFRMRYKFAIEEVTTKIAIPREEFEETYDHSPIEHVRSRLKWSLTRLSGHGWCGDHAAPWSAA